MSMLSTGIPPGPSPEERSATPTTPCCRRHWSTGPIAVFAKVLPRHLEIVYEINARFLDEVRIRFLR